MRKRIVAIAAAAVALPTGLVTPALAAPPGPVVVVSGLNNPRQLSWGEHGSLLIAEAGRGSLNGTHCFGSPEGGENCVGDTGSISLVAHPDATSNSSPNRIVRGLLSAAAPDGGAAVGSDGVSWQHGRLLIQETAYPPDALAGISKAWQNGRLLAAEHGHVSSVANIAEFELKNNPDGLQVDTDPYAVLSWNDRTAIVADAAANDVLTVEKGRVRLLAVLPLHGCGGVRTEQCDQEPVPTSLAKGPDHGAVYVGELAHFEPGEARVWKVNARTGALEGYYGKGGSICNLEQGLTTVTGIAFGRDGTLYVAELTGGENGMGQITRIARDCSTKTMSVPLPGGIAVDASNNIYVSAFSVSDADGAAPFGPGSDLPPGQVWRVRF